MVCRGSCSSALPVVAFAVAAVAAAGPDGCRRPVGRTVLIRPAAGCCLPRRAPTRRCRLGIWATPVASAGGAAAPRPGEGEGGAGGGGGEEDGDTADADADTDSASSPDAGAAAAASDDSEGASSVPLDVADAADGADREGPVAIEYLREGVNDEADSGDGDLIRLPLFPLSMVLHPGTEAVPLHIFEMKFRVRLRGAGWATLRRGGADRFETLYGDVVCRGQWGRYEQLDLGSGRTVKDGSVVFVDERGRDRPGEQRSPSGGVLMNSASASTHEWCRVQCTVTGERGCWWRSHCAEALTLHGFLCFLVPVPSTAGCGFAAAV